MSREVSYLELAKEAKSRGDFAGVWRAFKQHARVKRRQWEKEKAAASTATR